MGGVEEWSPETERSHDSQMLSPTQRMELHHFSDASSVGYGACSIPRLELSATVVSARTSAMLKNELEMKIDEEFFWTDSQVVLAYIHNDSRRFHMFVANRLEVIKEKTDPGQCHYVDTLETQPTMPLEGLMSLASPQQAGCQDPNSCGSKK